MNVYDLTAKYQGGFTKRRTSTKFIVVHHAAAHYKQQTGLEDVEAIRKWHMEQHHNWPGIGYHIVLAEESNGGPIARYNVSDLNLQRAHILNRNHECVGVCCATDFGNTIPLDKWIDALADVCRELAATYPGAEIVGHKEKAVPGGQTRCPGDRWLEWKPVLLQRVMHPREPDWPALWGGSWWYFAESGIAAAWRDSYRLGKPLGKAISDELQADGIVVRAFQKGYITYSPTGGIKVKEW